MIIFRSLFTKVFFAGDQMKMTCGEPADHPFIDWKNNVCPRRPVEPIEKAQKSLEPRHPNAQRLRCAYFLALRNARCSPSTK
jgi:hypothetical protein